MKKLFKFTGVILFALLICFKGFANDPQKPLRGCKSYDVKIETVTLLDEKDRENLTAGDAVSLKFPMELRHIDECPEETVSTLLNVKEVFEPWMPQFAKTVINEKGLSYYNEEGKLLYSYSAEELSCGKVEKHEAEEDTSPFDINEEYLASLKEEGIETEQTEQGLTLKGKGFELVIDKKNSSTYFTLVEEGRFKSSERINYSIEGKIAIPIKKTNETEDVTLSGFPFTKVVITTYSNYKLI